jgi:ribosome-associated toxin RatA of RatAB toxin-antitoxin module
MAKAQRAGVVDLTPARAFELWTDVSRWPTFIDGFAHVERIDDDWPEAGAKLVWRSVPTGRGIVTEKVRHSLPGERIQTDVLEERLVGTQTAEFAPADEGGTAVILTLDYKLVKEGPLAWLTDVLFIRRAQNDALARTVQRFGIEAAEEAAL